MSEHYKALTRKYRPRSFDDIVSQDHVSSTLKNAIANNRLSHAYLFCGPRGVGKTTMARVLARTINEIGDDVDGEALNNTLNIIEIDAASNNKVEDIHALRERVRIPPQSGRYKVYIIDEVHMLSKQAFNALLKTLEEPPEHAIFIFATTEPHKILPTILSRCQRFDFRRIKVEEIVSRLRFIADEEKITIDDESLHVIGKKADGALRDALGIFDQAIAFCGLEITSDDLYRALNVVSSERMFEIMTLIESQKSSEGIQLLNTLLQEGYDIQEFLSGMTEHLRNLYLAKDASNTYLIEATDEIKQKYQQASEPFSNDDLLRMMHIVNEAQFKIREAHQPKIHFEITMLKLMHMKRTGAFRDLLKELKTLQHAVTGKELPVTQSAAPRKEETPVAKKPATPEKPEEKKVEEPKQEEKTEAPQEIFEPSSRPAPEAEKQKSSPAPKPVEQQSTSESPAPDKKPGGIDLFGKPSLGSGPTMSAIQTTGPVETANEPASEEQVGSISGNLALAPKPQAKEKPLFEPGKTIYLHDIQNIWPEYLNLTKKRLEQILYFTLQRTTPVDLKDEVLIIECNDSFAYELIEERRQDYSRVLQTITGANIRIQGKLKQQTQEEQESLDPYTRFKKLQEKDTRLRSIVEIFGAELDFNHH